MSAPFKRAEQIVALIGFVVMSVLLFRLITTGGTVWAAWLAVAAGVTLVAATGIRWLAARQVERDAAADSSERTVFSIDRTPLYERLEVWLVAEGYDPFDVPQSATHLLIATGRPREITSIAYLHRFAHIMRVGRPIRHVIRPADLPGFDRMPNFATRLTVEQLAEFDRLTRFELSLEPAA